MTRRMCNPRNPDGISAAAAGDSGSQRPNSWKQGALRKVRSSVWLTALAYLADNVLASLGISRADPSPSDHLSGSNVEADFEYAKQVADTYVRFGSITGATAEIGPGGSAAVALLLLANGARKVDLVDRFSHPPTEDRKNLLYERIIAETPALREKGIEIDRLDASGINFHVGEAAAAEVFFARHRGYDTIVSCAVMEHLYDPIGSIESMHSALVPGGSMLHVIDFRDHGMFTEGGFHELEFLTIPRPLYVLMTRRRGRPNGILTNGYRTVLEQLGFEYEIRVSGLVGVGEIDPVPYSEIPSELRRQAEDEVRVMRPRLSARYRGLSDEDLATSVIVLSARKRIS